MKRKKRLLSALLTGLLAFAFAACDPGHTHTYSKEWSSDETSHWHVAVCEHDDQVSSLSEHQFNSGVVTKEATTAETGEKTYTCIICKYAKTEPIPRIVEEHEHKFDKQITDSEYQKYPADCLRKAAYYYSCECGQAGTATFERGDALNHNFSEYVYNNNATCTTDGTKTAACIRCAETDTIIAAGTGLGHSFTEYVYNNDAGCTVNGTKTAVCDRCTEIKTVDASGTALGHSYSDAWTKDSEYHWHQATCEHSNEVSGKTAHDWDEGAVTRESTDTVEGEKLYTCVVCGQTKTVSIGLSGHTHTYSDEWSGDDNYHWNSATCAHESEVKNKAAHEWDNGTVTKEATAYEQGNKRYACAVCNAVKDESIAVIFSYLVTFRDYDGSVLHEERVEPDTDATAPEDPEREGYRFTGWNKPFSGVTSDLDVVAQYVQAFIVTFVDYDNSIIDSQTIDIGKNAIKPEDPVRNNYEFIGWDGSFNSVTENLTLNAQYVRLYTVTFADYNGTVLKKETVRSGMNATAPANPLLDGYDFTGWDKEYKNVISDLLITAVYKIKTYTVKFVMPDGTVIGEIQTVEHGFSALAPEPPEFYLEGAGDFTKVYGFTKWNKPFDMVTEETVIQAVYNSAYTRPVIIIEFSKTLNGNVNLYVYNTESMMLNAIEFSINFSTDKGNISINTVTVNSASPLWIEDSKGNNNNQYVVNNNESIFTFAWTDANGKQFDWCSKVLTFSFSTDGAVVSAETFVVDSCDAVVSDGSGKNIEKVTPVVVYR